MNTFNRSFFLSLTFLLIITTLNATTSDEIDDNKAAIYKARQEQNADLSAGNLDKAAAIWTEDVTIRRGLGQAINGKTEYYALIKTNQNENKIIYTREPKIIEVSDKWPLAYESGSWNAKKTDQKDSLLMSGSYSAQWVKREGKWFIRSEIFVALTCDDENCTQEAQY